MHKIKLWENVNLTLLIMSMSNNHVIEDYTGETAKRLSEIVRDHNVKDTNYILSNMQ